MGSKMEEVVAMEVDEKTQEKVELDKSNCETSSNICSDSKKVEFLPSPSFSKLLEGVVLAANSAVSSTNPLLQPTVPFQGQFGMSHQETLGTVTAIGAQALHQKETQEESLESLSKQSPLLLRETLSPKLSSVQDKVDKRNPDTNDSEVPKTPKSDGYSWRKYGQKHVKNSRSSRSYFRCSDSSCCAKKKVQHFDESGEIIEVIYKGNHNHDPPPYITKSFSRKKSFNDSSVENLGDPCKEESKQVLLLTYESQDTHLISSVGTLKSDINEQCIKIPDTTRHETEPSTLPVEKDHVKHSNCNELALTDTMNERDIPIKKRRIKESSQSVYRTFKEPKVVVHAPGDAGISSDGYRWRKYGQKMVKGNQHPRSYYRCSSNGCPVRKHVERATDGSLAIVAMYEGEHDHDKPLPKKQNLHNPLKPSILVDAPPSDIVNNVPLLKLEEAKSTSPGRESSALPHEVSNNDCGEQKGQTLISIGIELESC